MSMQSTDTPSVAVPVATHAKLDVSKLTPKITLKNAGREHWPDCYCTLFAGAGIKQGAIYGKSDKIGAYPLEGACGPADFVATLYHLLGIDPHREEHDQLNRPFQLTKGNPLTAVMI